MKTRKNNVGKFALLFAAIIGLLYFRTAVAFALFSVSDVILLFAELLLSF
jgi:hypothetical protein